MNEQVEAYLSRYASEVMERYGELRRLIYDSAPCAPEERLWAKLPSYFVGAAFVRLIPFKDHINMEARAVVRHRDELTGYRITPTGMLQVFLNQPIPYDALKRIIAETFAEERACADGVGDRL